MHKHQRGVTLIELMIVVLVMSILASIAIPSYRQYMLRSRRTDATAALMRIQAAEEKFFMQNMRYTNDLVSASPAGLGLGAISDGGHYDLAVVLAGGNMAYTATASQRPGGGQTDDAKCSTFSIDQTGIRNATGTATDPRTECWR